MEDALTKVKALADASALFLLISKNTRNLDIIPFRECFSGHLPQPHPPPPRCVGSVLGHWDWKR